MTFRAVENTLLFATWQKMVADTGVPIRPEEILFDTPWIQDLLNGKDVIELSVESDIHKVKRSNEKSKERKNKIKS